MRFVQDEDEVYLFAEIRNVSGASQIAPAIEVELFSGGASYGSDRFSSENAWVAPAGSAYYKKLNLFDSSLPVGSWDEEKLTLIEPRFSDPTPALYEAVRTEGEHVFNDGTEPLPPVYFITIIRDGRGIYMASCSGPNTGVTIPPGRDVLAVGLGDGRLPSCGFSSAGMLATQSLGITGDLTSQDVLAYIDE